MEFNSILEIIKTNPACYFIAGVVLGYFLRGFSFALGSRNQRPSRYQSKTVDSVAKRSSSVVVDLPEPSFDLSDVTMKTFTSRKIGGISLDQHRNEFQ